MNDGVGEEGLREQYRLSVEEYRFQVDLNWRRSEYFFVLNIGVLVAGATLLASAQVPRALVGLVFSLGALLALLSIFANQTQHGYYRGARDLEKDIEGRLGLGRGLALATTPGQGSSVERLGRVGTFLRTMLVAIACVDLIGAGIAAADAIEGRTTSAKQVSIRIPALGDTRKVVVVVSEHDEVLATRSGLAGGLVGPIGLEPGSYRIWIAGPRICSALLFVTRKPLQLAAPTCRPVGD